MLQAKGVYCQTWSGAAKQNLVHQLPLIAETLPEITAYYPATVNVRFEPMIVVAGSDARTPPLRWKPGGEDGEAGEVFDFVRVRLTIGDRPPLAALLYVGHWSMHRLDPHKHEFLVERYIDGLQDGLPVTMECGRRFVELPYTKTTSSGDGPYERRAGDEARTFVIL